MQGTRRPTYTTNNGNAVAGQPQAHAHQQQQTVKTPRPPMEAVKIKTFRPKQPWPQAQQAPAPQTYQTSIRYPSPAPYTAQQYTQHNSVSNLKKNLFNSIILKLHISI